MPVEYTNRKGKTYTLCQGKTRTGKPRYYFASQPKDVLVEQVPLGYAITESVADEIHPNGIVSLAKQRPQQIRPQERAAVEAAVARHPKSERYRVDVKGKQILVYELVGPDADDLIDRLSKYAAWMPDMAERLRADQEQHGQFSQVMRFTLTDEETRLFFAERWCYRGRIDGWIDIHRSGEIGLLAKTLIPTLGTDRFFDLY